MNRSPDPSDETTRTMRKTAASLEVTEAALHRSADTSPDPGTARRLDRLGDHISAEAREIDRRAERLSRQADLPG